MPLKIEDHAELARWLVGHGHARNVETVRCRTLHGGVSNRTVWVEVGGEQASEGHVPGPRGVTRWVLEQALTKLRVKDEWLSDVDRIRREAEALRVLPELAPAGTVTPLVFEAPGENLLAMEAVPSGGRCPFRTCCSCRCRPEAAPRDWSRCARWCGRRRAWSRASMASDR